MLLNRVEASRWMMMATVQLRGKYAICLMADITKRAPDPGQMLHEVQNILQASCWKTCFSSCLIGVSLTGFSSCLFFLGISVSGKLVSEIWKARTFGVDHHSSGRIGFCWFRACTLVQTLFFLKLPAASMKKGKNSSTLGSFSYSFHDAMLSLCPNVVSSWSNNLINFNWLAQMC